MLKQDDFCKAKLVETGWRFGSTYNAANLGGQMVMTVIANRVRCGWGSWLDVIQRVPAYMAENVLPPLEFPSVWDAQFIKLLHAVDAIYDGSNQDLTKGALYWGSLDKIERDWFKDRIISPVSESTGLRQHAIVANMNALTFWK